MSEKKNVVSESAAENKSEKEFSIQRIYLKDLSFETPGSPDIFREQWQPNMSLDINTQYKSLVDSVYEVILVATVTVKSEEKQIFLVEAKYAGIFTIRGFTDAEVGSLLGSVAPSILFPYIRECVSEIANRGSFPQLILAPVNFDALYAEYLQKQKASTSETIQ